MQKAFVDLHIHIGRTKTGKAVKITGSKTLTLQNIVDFASSIKGLHMIGVIDCHVPEVISELEETIQNGVATEHQDGGIVFANSLVLLLGSEIEVYDEHSSGPIHVLVYLPTLKKMKQFSEWLAPRMKNRTLSSQRIYESGIVLQEKVKALQGLFIPAHVFTPFKSVYGKGVKQKMSEVFRLDLIDAVELGLSSDTSMAEEINELSYFPFLTNSDAHSLEKIAREYQVMAMNDYSFKDLHNVLQEKEGCHIIANYGLNPKLGKYYKTSCAKCYKQKSADVCQCGHRQFIKGVSERIQELKGEGNRKQRPPYIHQIPLEFIPKLGPKTLQALRDHFKTDMDIIHHVSKQQLQTVVKDDIATLIDQARLGKLLVEEGGAGRYGKVKREEA
ncbi:endonuclease Q family protein [Alkalihalobacillus sp. LMS39]|uniref:endonuclease Q family protein n=1 Tax=Alkalihalobacillus sp. LMS39 TaxID=2924032 RepID=UPI001FB3905E|nr:endonuclease Q family protein [Alkalihalobacillus sp. LMS39]UOE96120.1 endonuclease Q family protein [Alkalihalobacillus sp. LMS39]